MAYLKHKGNDIICRIDVTAFAAVMLAILAPFLYIASIQVHPRAVDLVKAEHALLARGARREDAMFVAVMRDGTLYWGETKIVASKLPSAIQKEVANGAERRVYVKADARAKYRDVVEVIDSIRDAGIEDITFICQKSHPTIIPGFLDPER
jgi:biopolymer transport protein TolR